MASDNVVSSRSLANRRLTLQSLLVGAGIAVLSIYAYATGHRADQNGDIACLNNVKQLSTGMLMYTQDYDEMYPPMKFYAQTKKLLFPYVKKESLFTCPVTNTEYLLNPALNYVPVRTIQAPATFVMLRDAKPHQTEGGQTWAVGYTDGHAKRVSTEPLLGKLAQSSQPGKPKVRAKKARK